MGEFYVVEPEVAGDWGENTKFTRTPGTPTEVHALHYDFNGWLGDCLLATSPCFIITETAAQAMADAGLAGFSTDAVEVTTSSEFDELFPGVVLPPFVWLKVGNRPGLDDLGITADLDLVVSERALMLLKEQGVSNALVEPFEA